MAEHASSPAPGPHSPTPAPAGHPASSSTAPSAPDGAAAWLAQHCGEAVAELEAMPSGAGARRYWRVHGVNGQTWVFMWARPEDPAILPPALRAAEPGSIPFLEIAGFLREHDIPVPMILGSDVARRWILLEDLGTRHLCDLEGDARVRAHERAIDLLARAHRIAPPTSTDRTPLPFRRQFDAAWVRFELRLFLAMRWSEQIRSRLEPLLEALIEGIVALPRVLSFRDYQSQNLLLDPAGELRVIDFQDALLATAGLDLAALLWDSYLPISSAERAVLLERYNAQVAHPISPAALACVALQRKCKDFSRFHSLIHRVGDARYRPALAQAASAIRDNSAALPAELAPLRPLLDDALREQGA